MTLKYSCFLCVIALHQYSSLGSQLTAREDHSGPFHVLRQHPERRTQILLLSGYQYGVMNKEQLEPWVTNKKNFANQHHVDFVFERSSNYTKSDVASDGRKLKPHWIQKWLRKYKWIYWSDVDCVMQCDDTFVNVREFIKYPTSMTSLTQHEWLTNTHFIGIGHPPGRQLRFSNFAFFIKQHPSSFKFLRHWKEWEFNKCSCWGDQGAMWIELVHWVYNFNSYADCETRALKACTCDFQCFESSLQAKGYNTLNSQQANTYIQFFFNTSGIVSFGMQNSHWRHLKRAESERPYCLHKQFSMLHFKSNNLIC
tara:strand:+ start:16082 stop:17014 length:933 start_codon:yes stop_codon:yes gene_type:complete